MFSSCSSLEARLKSVSFYPYGFRISLGEHGCNFCPLPSGDEVWKILSCWLYVDPGKQLLSMLVPLNELQVTCEQERCAGELVKEPGGCWW